MKVCLSFFMIDFFLFFPHSTLSVNVVLFRTDSEYVGNVSTLTQTQRVHGTKSNFSTLSQVQRVHGTQSGYVGNACTID